LLSEKLNNELKLTRNPLDVLENISAFLKRLDYELSLELTRYVLKNVPIIEKAVKILVNKYISLINNGEMDNISEDSLVLSLIEVYCDENEIKTLPDEIVFNQNESRSLESIAIYCFYI